MDKSFEQQLHLNSDVTNFTSEEFLHLNSCGISRYTYQDKSLAIRYFRPKGRLDFHLLYLTSGRAEVVVGDKTFSASAGDFVFYPPNTPQDYTYFISEDSPVNSSFYVHFCGTVAEEITEKAGFKEAVLLHRESEEVKRLFTAMITANASGDRLSACAAELARIGVKTTETEDSLTIYGLGPDKPALPEGTVFQTYNDHRMAMSCSLLGLASGQAVAVDKPSVVRKSFPKFWEVWSALL